MLTTHIFEFLLIYLPQQFSILWCSLPSKSKRKPFCHTVETINTTQLFIFAQMEKTPVFKTHTIKKAFDGLCAHLINVINLKYLHSTSFYRWNVKCLHSFLFLQQTILGYLSGKSDKKQFLAMRTNNWAVNMLTEKWLL